MRMRNVGVAPISICWFYNVGKTLAREDIGMSLMQRLTVMTAIVGALGAVPMKAAQQSPVKSDQDVLIELEQKWNEAFYGKDVGFIQSILADEFIATYDDGSRGDKAKELALAASFDQAVTSAV